jgi:RNA polymerase sigma-70 factor (ECF subfamily)
VTDEADDLQLLEAWRNGDRPAGSELFRRHFEAVYRFFDTKLIADVDELTQRTFVGCVEAQDRLEGLRSFKAYLFGIARKQLLRWCRERQKAEMHDPLGELTAESAAGSPSHRVKVRERERMILAALRQIPMDLQIAVELFYWERLSLQEIALVLEIAEGTVKSRLHRAKSLLRARIEKQAGPSPLRQAVLASFDDSVSAARPPPPPRQT